jgi:hypothetical protein
LEGIEGERGREGGGTGRREERTREIMVRSDEIRKSGKRGGDSERVRNVVERVVVERVERKSERKRPAVISLSMRRRVRVPCATCLLVREREPYGGGVGMGSVGGGARRLCRVLLIAAVRVDRCEGRTLAGRA